MKYNHAAIKVVDLAESKEFYELLGMKQFREWKRSDEALEAIVMVKDSFILELVHHPSNVVTPRPTIIESSHIGFSVEELPNLLEKLKGIGIEIARPLTKGITVKELAFIVDPNGNIVELLVEN